MSRLTKCFQNKVEYNSGTFAFKSMNNNYSELGYSATVVLLFCYCEIVHSLCENIYILLSIKIDKCGNCSSNLQLCRMEK